MTKTPSNLKPRSSTTTSIFEAFVNAIRQEDSLDNDIAKRLGSFFEERQSIKAPTLEKILFKKNDPLLSMTMT